uniref:Uncharacterized protein n=1 Tax=Glossina austeni TaxID=7395 RepID=A0A1A9V423_GLOAU
MGKDLGKETKPSARSSTGIILRYVSAIYILSHTIQLIFKRILDLIGFQWQASGQDGDQNTAMNYVNLATRHLNDLLNNRNQQVSSSLENAKSGLSQMTGMAALKTATTATSISTITTTIHADVEINTGRILKPNTRDRVT